MNTKTLLLAILAFFLVISVASATELPPKKPLKQIKRAPKSAKAPPSEYIPQQEAKKAAKKLNTKIPPKGSDEIPKTR
ncbi:hypothetical protein H8356DRAFT_852667, partial [Neocallimastix lanati (nom. inval.)]